MTSISSKPDPAVLHITVADVVEALGKGLRDFRALPSYGIILGAVYAIGGLVIIVSITAFGMSYLAYPFAAGFALIAPFVAAGFYELSRQRERGQPPSAREAWSAIKSHRELGWMAFVTIFAFIVWMYLAQFLMALFLGLHPPFSTLPGRRGLCDRHDHERTRSNDESCPDDRLGCGYCCSANRIGTNVLPRPANHIASTGAHDLASLPTHGVASV
jgi:hypothetical protein